MIQSDQDLKRDISTEQTQPLITASLNRPDQIGWWLKLLIQPVLLLLVGAGIIFGLGLAQKYGYITSGSVTVSEGSSSTDADVQYICPMMCTPPQSEPGRCPVCAMKLVASTSGGQNGDSRSIVVDAASRRIANIETVPVMSIQAFRTIKAIGQLKYDEGNLKTLSAYVNGRIEKLYADYTGVLVKEGDNLAYVYSPKLYTSQVEYLLAKKSNTPSLNDSSNRLLQPNINLLESAKQRLIEFGMTPDQIEELEQAGKANSRLHLSAPISGTVIDKFVTEGQYIKEGDAIYKLVDLSTMWLMLELFPEDAAAVRYGQKVEAELQSFPGKIFTGRIAFIDPNVNPKTKTVGVRVVLENPDNLLKIGDFSKATIQVPVVDANDLEIGIYDPELADKWISPRHPHVIESKPGKCKLCGIELVPASKFGFANMPNAEMESLVVPRNAVLMAGNNSIVYVEVEPGRFELRNVVLGPSLNDLIVIKEGVESGELVASRGNFLIDSQMQLAGNPSLIDPTKYVEPQFDEESDEISQALAQLSDEDRSVVEKQKFCPVTLMRLGSMGVPIQVDVNGTFYWICCEGCRSGLLNDTEKHIDNLNKKLQEAPGTEEESDSDVPPIGDLQAIEDDDDLPPIEDLQMIDDLSLNEFQLMCVRFGGVTIS